MCYYISSFYFTLSILKSCIIINTIAYFRVYLHYFNGCHPSSSVKEVMTSVITSSEAVLGSLVPPPLSLLTQQIHVEVWKLVSIVVVAGACPQPYVYRLEYFPVRVHGLLHNDLIYQRLTIHPVSTLHLVLAKGRFLVPLY